MKFYEDFLLYEGGCYSVYFHAEEKGVSEVSEYFERCDNDTQTRLLYLVKRISDIGRIYDITKFRLEDPKNKIYAFKPKKDRFFCFFVEGKRILITSGYRKVRQKTDKNELKRAIAIKKKYEEKKHEKINI